MGGGIVRAVRDGGLKSRQRSIRSSVLLIKRGQKGLQRLAVWVNLQRTFGFIKALSLMPFF